MGDRYRGFSIFEIVYPAIRVVPFFVDRYVEGLGHAVEARVRRGGYVIIFGYYGEFAVFDGSDEGGRFVVFIVDVEDFSGFS